MINSTLPFSNWIHVALFNLAREQSDIYLATLQALSNPLHTSFISLTSAVSLEMRDQKGNEEQALAVQVLLH